MITWKQPRCSWCAHKQVSQQCCRCCRWPSRRCWGGTAARGSPCHCPDDPIIQWHRIGSFWRARETKALVYDTYHIHMFSNAGCFHTLILFHVVVKVGNTLVWSNSPQSPISTVRSEKEDLSKVNSFIFFSRKEDLSKQHLFSWQIHIARPFCSASFSACQYHFLWPFTKEMVFNS